MKKGTFKKSIILAIGITLFSYTFGVILVDVLGWKYYYSAWIIIIIPFLVRYYFNKNWVFNQETGEKEAGGKRRPTGLF